MREQCSTSIRAHVHAAGSEPASAWRSCADSFPTSRAVAKNLTFLPCRIRIGAQIWHGTSDPIVQPSNGEAIIRQWANVHGLAERPSCQGLVRGHTRRIWTDANGELLVEAFSISGMAHGVPLATVGGESCGAAGAFFLDVGISSTHHIARFWHLHESIVEMPAAASPRSAAIQIPTDGSSFVLLGAPAAGSQSSAEGSQHKERQTRYPLDPNAVIAAAFRAAGLPVPEIPAATPTPRVASGPIIAAALKAARRLSNLTPDEQP